MRSPPPAAPLPPAPAPPPPCGSRRRSSPAPGSPTAAPSATPAVISMPRMIGPGCSTTACGACAARRWPGELVAWPCTRPDRAAVRPAARPGCAASSPPATGAAPHRSRARSRCRVPSRAAKSGNSSFGPQSSTRAPSRGSSSMLERATRLCRMSPTMRYRDAGQRFGGHRR